jgi:hypothetical protein
VKTLGIGDAYQGVAVFVGFVGDAKHGAGSCGLLAEMSFLGVQWLTIGTGVPTAFVLAGFVFDFGGAVLASGDKAVEIFVASQDFGHGENFASVKAQVVG